MATRHAVAILQAGSDMLNLPANGPAPDSPPLTLWLLDIDGMPDQDEADARRWLSPSEAVRFDKFIRRERRAQFLFGRMLLRHAVGIATGVSPSAIEVVEQPNASPRVILPGGRPLPGFSLSHSQQWIACATGAGVHAGVDIEVIDPERNIEALASTAFHNEERAWLVRQDSGERITAFYRMWTLKEALVKLRSAQRLPEVAAPLAGAEGRLQSGGEGWFASFPPHAHLSICLCSTRPIEHIVTVPLTELTI